MQTSDTSLVHSIVETYDPGIISSLKSTRFVSIPLALSVFVIAGAGINAMAIIGGVDVLGSVVIYAVIAGPIVLAAAVSRSIQQYQKIPRTITFDDGNFWVSDARNHDSQRISDCCWFHGKATDDTNLSFQPLRDPAIVVVFPSGRNVACGLTEERYSDWLAVLKSCQCRRVLRQEGALGYVFGLLVIAGLVIGGITGWYAAAAIQNRFFPQMLNNQFADFAPAAAAILLAWLLSASPWLIPGWRRFTDRERQLFMRSAIMFPLKLAIPAGVLFGGNRAAGITLAGVFIAVFLCVSWWMTKRPSASA